MNGEVIMKKINLKFFILVFIIFTVGVFVAEAIALSFTPVTPCRIVDTRRTSAGIIDASTQRDFRVFGSGSVIGAQGGNSLGCPSPEGEPLAVHINMVAANPTGKGNLQAFPVGAGTGAGLSVNYNTIDTNLANAGPVKTVTGAGPDITVASNFSSAHAVIDVLGYYYKSNFAPVPATGMTISHWPGDDGDLQKGVSWPDPRFTDNGDGTVTDNLTELIWLKNADCFGVKSLEEALNVSNSLADGQCGLNDGYMPGEWRLPNLRELQSLVDYGMDHPALPSAHPFSDVRSYLIGYWSSTAGVLSLPTVWSVHFADGSVTWDPPSHAKHVWPVTGGN